MARRHAPGQHPARLRGWGRQAGRRTISRGKILRMAGLPLVQHPDLLCAAKPLPPTPVHVAQAQSAVARACSKQLTQESRRPGPPLKSHRGQGHRVLDIPKGDGCGIEADGGTLQVHLGVLAGLAQALAGAQQVGAAGADGPARADRAGKWHWGWLEGSLRHPLNTGHPSTARCGSAQCRTPAQRSATAQAGQLTLRLAPG